MKRIIAVFAFILVGISAFAQQTPNKVRPVCGPIIENPGPTGFTVVWETNMDAVAWVEVAPDDGTHFYNRERRKYYDMRGFGNQVISNIHKVRVDGLEPGTAYRYRIMMKGVMKFDGPGNVDYTRTWGSDVYKKNPYRTTTPKKDYDRLRFDVYNDIHQKDSVLNVLMKGSKMDEVDFAVFNGDMVSSLAWKEKIRDTYLATGAANLAGKVPLYNLRGNHEFRGKDTSHWFDYVELPEGKPYWTAAWGRYFFIFLDTCEDKPDSDLEYGGTMLSEPYMKEQAAWLSGVVKSEQFRQAAVRIVIGHIPPRRKGWFGDRVLNEQIVPILNKTGISVWIAGHLHRWCVDEPGVESDADFPVVINSNCERLEVSVSKSGVSMEAFAPDGSKTHSYDCPAK